MFQERGSSGKASKLEASAGLQAPVDVLIKRSAAHSVITRATGGGTSSHILKEFIQIPDNDFYQVFIIVNYY